MKTRTFNSGIMERFMTTKELDDFTEKYKSNRKSISGGWGLEWIPTDEELKQINRIGIDSNLKEVAKSMGLRPESLLRRLGKMKMRELSEK